MHILHVEYAALLAFLNDLGLWSPVLPTVVVIGRRGIVQPAALHALEEALQLLGAPPVRDAVCRAATRTMRRASTLCAEHACHILYMRNVHRLYGLTAN